MTVDPTSADPALPADASSLAGSHERLAAIAEQQRFNAQLAISTQLGRQFGRTLSAAFVGLAVQGKSFGDVLGSLALGLSKLALGAAFKPLEGVLGTVFQSLLQAPSPFSGGSLAAPASLPLTAGAGLAGAGSSAASGAPGAASAAASGSAPSIVLNVTTPDAESFRRSETQLAAVLARAVGQGQRNL